MRRGPREDAQKRVCSALPRLTCSRSHWARAYRPASLAVAVALLSAAASSGCGSAKRDGLYDALAGAGGAAGGTGLAGSAGSSTGGSSDGGSGGFAGDGAGGAGSGGTSGGGGDSGAAGSGGGAGGGGGSSALPDLDAGTDASFADASAASRLGCAPAQQVDCNVLSAALRHRYSFAGTGSAVRDGVGTAHGSVINGQLSGSGAVVLTGAATPENYVDLPNGMLSALGSATLEAWVSWDGGDPWQRIFDFGSGQGAEDAREGGDAYLFLTPRSDADTVRAAFISSETLGEVQLDSTAPLPSGAVSHVAVVVDGQAGTLALFIAGAPVGSIALPSSLAALATDDNNWLGRSEFPADPAFDGSLLELRIYSAALSAAQLALSFQLGPDAAVSE